MKNKFNFYQGFGIVEVMVSIIILMFALVGFFSALPLGRNVFNELKEERIAVLLAIQMMEEIQSKAYEDPDIPQGSFGSEEPYPRGNFDDIDDYDGWSMSPPEYQNGTSMNGDGDTPDYNDFCRKVVVKNVDDNDYSITRKDGTTNSKRVVVTVTSPKIEDVIIKWVATRNGMNILY